PPGRPPCPRRGPRTCPRARGIGRRPCPTPSHRTTGRTRTRRCPCRAGADHLGRVVYSARLPSGRRRLPRRLTIVRARPRGYFAYNLTPGRVQRAITGSPRSGCMGHRRPSPRPLSEPIRRPWLWVTFVLLILAMAPWYLPEG